MYRSQMLWIAGIMRGSLDRSGVAVVVVRIVCVVFHIMKAV